MFHGKGQRGMKHSTEWLQYSTAVSYIPPRCLNTPRRCQIFLGGGEIFHGGVKYSTQVLKYSTEVSNIPPRGSNIPARGLTIPWRC